MEAKYTMEAKDVIREAVKHGACSASGGVTDWESLCRLFFSPQGREFCEDNDFPPIGMFRSIKEHGVDRYGVFIDSGDICRTDDKDIALIGDTCGELAFNDNKVVHKVILMHGAKAHITAGNYVVLLIINVGDCEVAVDKDETAIVL